MHRGGSRARIAALGNFRHGYFGPRPGSRSPQRCSPRGVDRIHFFEGDLLGPIRSGLSAPVFLDLVVSNPPYLGRQEQAELPREVRDHEPPGALFAGPTGVELYPRSLGRRNLLGENGIMVLELGHNSLQHVQSIFSKGATWHNVTVRNDLAGLARVISAVRVAACYDFSGKHYEPSFRRRPPKQGCRALIFDFDYTLADSTKGVLECIRFAIPAK